MKTLHHIVLLTIIGLAMAGLTANTVAQSANYVMPFDEAASDTSWIRWWGVEFAKPTWDGTMDAASSAASGSLKSVIPFTGAKSEQFCFFGTFSGNQWDSSVTLDGSKYTNLTFDIRVDPSTPLTSAGDYGPLEIGLATASWAQVWLNGWPLPQGSWRIPARASNEWVKAVIAIDPAMANLNPVAGIILKMWSDGVVTGPLTFWVDNITLNAREQELPPPVVGIEKALPGLQIFASQPGAVNQRQSIRTVGETYSFAQSAIDPVEYSVTLTNFPSGTFSGFQAHLMLVPTNGMPYGPDDTAIDWNATHCVFVQIANNADGSANGRFMYKTNQPGGNSMLWGAGTLGTVGNSTPLGTWTVKFEGTNITLTAPSGTSTNFAMPEDALALFANPLHAYFGIQPNGAGNVGQSALFSNIKIFSYDPTILSIDDSFTDPTLNTATWKVVAGNAAGVVVVPADAAYWINWTLPADGYRLRTKALLESDMWFDLPLTPILMGNRSVMLIPAASLPSAEMGFFRLSK